MNILTTVNRRCAIVYDGDRIKDPSESLFDPDAWARDTKLAGQAPGRGSALFVDASFGAAVLRWYYRGGWPARVSRDRYFFTGWRRSRPFREFALLAELAGVGLPVPEPLAALCVRGRLGYRGALLTRRLEDAEPLAESLGALDAADETWPAMGACIARFHAAGVSHADLNARNILLRRPTGEVFLVDFDRSKYTPGRAVSGTSNLARLLRSLRKTWPGDSAAGVDPSWQALLRGYRS